MMALLNFGIFEILRNLLLLLEVSFAFITLHMLYWMISDTTTTTKESASPKSVSCFDISPCDRLLAAGTDLTEGDAFILFWDVRNTNLLGAYWESHTDDITEVVS